MIVAVAGGEDGAVIAVNALGMSSESFFAVYVALCLGLYAANVWAWRHAEHTAGRADAWARLWPLSRSKPTPRPWV
jgi:hypothetical protein